MKKHRIYIDTSVFGGYFDSEFEEYTKPLFNRIDEGEFIILFSPVTQDELENAPSTVRNLVTNLKSCQTKFLETTDEVVTLATVNRADLLISWNFKHIVNMERIRGYNSINIKNGYKQLEIRSSRDLMNYENEA